MSGHTSWSQIRRGSGAWYPVAGDDQHLHWFSDTEKVQWWLQAKCGAGPAVGRSESDARRLEPCPVCLPLEPEDLEDVEGVHL